MYTRVPKLFVPIMAALALLSSCVQAEIDGSTVLLSGTWAQVDENMMTKHVVSFESGYFVSTESEVPCLVAEKCVWHCQKSDFAQKSSSRYSLADGVLSYGKHQSSVVVEKDKMTMDKVTYVRVESFKEAYYRTVTMDKPTVECDFKASDAIAYYSLSNFGAYTPVASCSEPWVKDISCEGTAVHFKVDATDHSREATVTLSYFGQEDVSFTVCQKANRKITVSPEAVYADYTKQYAYLSYAVTNATSEIPYAKPDAGWVSFAGYSDSLLALLFTENNSGSTRTCNVVVSYPDADDVVIPVTQTYNAPVVYVSKTSFNVSPDEGTYTTAYHIDYPREGVTLTPTKPDWVKAVNMDGDKIVFTVAANNTSGSRSGSITLKYGSVSTKIDITQASRTFSVSTSSWSGINFKGASNTVTVTANSAWDVACPADWITISQGTSSGNSTPLTLTAAHNYSLSARSATITIKTATDSRTITVSQNAPSVSANISSVDFAWNGAAVSKTINSEIPLTLSVDQPWLTPSAYTFGAGSWTYTLTPALNDAKNAQARTAKVKLYNNDYGYEREYTVSQAAFAPSMSLSTSTYSGAASSFNCSVNVSSNISWTASCDQSWVSLNKASYTGTGSVASTAVSMTVDANPGTSSRTATVTFSNATYDIEKTYVITQGATGVKLEVGAVIWHSNVADASSTSISVDANVSWDYACDQDWLTVTKKDGAVQFATKKNTTGSSRECLVTIYNSVYGIFHTIKVDQPAFVFSFTPSAKSVDYKSQKFDLAISATTSWTISSSYSWLTVSKSSGTNGATVTVSVAENTSIYSRSGSLSIYDKYENKTYSLTIDQAPTPYLTLSSENWSPEYYAYSAGFSFSTNYDWTASSNASWLTIDQSSGTAGSAYIVLSITENSSTTSSRTGTITIRAGGLTKTITVTQAKKATLTVSSSTLTANCGSQTLSSISVTADVSWTATCNASWATLSKTSGSSGTSSITISVNGNNSTSSRQATVIIQNSALGLSRTITVTQYGYTQCAIYLNNKILNLGVPLDRTSSYTYVIKNWTSNGSSLLQLSGTTSDNNDWRFFKSGSYYYFDWGSGRISYYYSASTTGAFRKFVLKNYQMTYYSSETATSYTWTKSGTAQSTIPSSTNPLYLGSTSESLYFKSLEVRNSSNTLTHRFIGVNTNGTVGVFDTVTGKLVVGGTQASL